MHHDTCFYTILVYTCTRPVRAPLASLSLITHTHSHILQTLAERAHRTTAANIRTELASPVYTVRMHAIFSDTQLDSSLCGARTNERTRCRPSVRSMRPPSAQRPTLTKRPPQTPHTHSTRRRRRTEPPFRIAVHSPSATRHTRITITRSFPAIRARAQSLPYIFAVSRPRVVSRSPGLAQVSLAGHVGCVVCGRPRSPGSIATCICHCST